MKKSFTKLNFNTLLEWWGQIRVKLCTKMQIFDQCCCCNAKKQDYHLKTIQLRYFIVTL